MADITINEISIAAASVDATDNIPLQTAGNITKKCPISVLDDYISEFISVGGILSPKTPTDTMSIAGLSLTTTPLAVSSGGSGQSSYTDGELLIGNTTGNTLTKAHLTGGVGIGITEGHGSITITNALPDPGYWQKVGTVISPDIPTDTISAAGITLTTTPLAVSSGGSGQSSYTNGELLIGNTTGNTLTKAHLTAGTGIAITNGAGSITIENTAGTTSYWKRVTGVILPDTPTDTLSVPSIALTTSALSVSYGGTGETSYTDGQLLIGNTTGNTLTKASLTAGTGISITNGHGSITVTNSAPDLGYWTRSTGVISAVTGTDTLSMAGITLTTTPLGVSSGGSGQSSYTDGQLLIGNTTGNTLDKGTLTAGTGISITNGHGSITITNTATGTTYWTKVGSVISPDTPTDTLSVPSVTLTTTALAVTSGGTGESSYTNGQLLIGNTTGNTLVKSTLTAGTGIAITNGSGSITIENTASGTSYWTRVGSVISPHTPTDTLSVPSISLTTTALTVGNGGTGQTSYTDGQLLIGNTTGNTLDKGTLTAGSGISITNGHGTITITNTESGISYWTKVGSVISPHTPTDTLSVPEVTLTTTPLAVTSGGNGQTSYTDGQLMIGNSTGNTLTKGTLTAGSGISITNGHGSITITNNEASYWTKVGSVISPETPSDTLSVPSLTLSSSPLAVSYGGTGHTSTYSDGELLIGNSVGHTLGRATLTAGTGISIANGNGSITITNSSPDSGYWTRNTGVLSATSPTDSLHMASLTLTTTPLAVTSGGNGQTSYTDGQLMIGNTTGNTLTKGTLTAGAGISITNGHGSITITNTLPDSQYWHRSAGVLTPETSTDTISAAGITLTTTPLAVTSGGSGQTSYTDGQLLIGNTTGNTLTKAHLTAGTGISITNGSGAITITNTSPDSGFWKRTTGVISAVTGTDTLSIAGITLTTTPLAVTGGGTGNTTFNDGQLLIGNSTGNTLTKAALTAGDGIAIANGHGTITISNSQILLTDSIVGLKIENDSGDTANYIRINIGRCADSTLSKAMNLSVALVKRIDANWQAGTNMGGFPSSLTLAVDTTYHFFLIMHTNGTIDAGFDSSVTAANLLSDSGYTYYRRIGSIITAGGGPEIMEFTQLNDTFLLSAGLADTSISFYMTDETKTVDLKTPSGIVTKAIISFLPHYQDTGLVSAQILGYFYSIVQDGGAPALVNNFSAGYIHSDGYTIMNSGRLEIHTNESSQIGVSTYTLTPTGAPKRITLYINVDGWIDDRSL